MAEYPEAPSPLHMSRRSCTFVPLFRCTSNTKAFKMPPSICLHRGGDVSAYCGHFQYVAQRYHWILHVKAINMLAKWEYGRMSPQFYNSILSEIVIESQTIHSMKLFVE